MKPAKRQAMQNFCTIQRGASTKYQTATE